MSQVFANNGEIVPREERIDTKAIQNDGYITRLSLLEKYTPYSNSPSPELVQMLADDIVRMKDQIARLGPKTLTHKWRRIRRKDLGILLTQMEKMKAAVERELILIEGGKV